MAYQNIPAEMRALHQWVCWKYVERGGAKPTKVPINPKTKLNASPTDQSTWGTFEQAIAAADSFDGIGFFFGKDDPYTGIDLDDPKVSENDLAVGNRIINEFNSYTEVSPSGTGLHIVVKGKIPCGRRRDKVEVYSQDRFFTMTGKVFNGAPITERQENLTILFNQMAPHNEGTAGLQADEPETLTDAELVALILASPEAAAIYNINPETYSGDKSSADLSLCDWLAIRSRRRAQGERVWLASPLGARVKTQTRLDYRKRTIEEAFNLPALPAVDLNGKTCNGEPIRHGLFVPPAVITTEPPGISEQEWFSASATPKVIVANLYHEDVGVLLAAGGTGKTTLMLHIMLCIVLDFPVFGMPVMSPGPVVFITGEDSRETIVARLRSIATAMNLTRDQLQKLMADFRISDESGSGFKLTEVQRDVVRPTSSVDHMIACLTTLSPVLIVVDPAVSFGVGESRINDAEQGLIEAGRRIRNALKCCVLYVHHIGKSNSRDQSWDQYAGRGGSAFADGARMVHVMHPLTPAEFYKATGVELAPGETGLGFARPKMTFCSAQPHIYIKRNGYKFDVVERRKIDLAAKVEGHANQVLEILNKDLAADKRHSRNSLEALDHGIKRTDLRATITWLIEAGRLEEQLMIGAGRGGMTKYLRPIASPVHYGEPMPTGGQSALLPDA
jgi:RecA-family ATPase